MKKWIALLLILTVLASCFVACSSDKKETEEEKTTSEEITSTEEEKTDETTIEEPETEEPENNADVVGTYSCTVDANSDLVATFDEDTQAMFVMGLAMNMTMTFNDDMTCETAATMSGVDNVLAYLVEYSITAAAEQNNMTVEEFWQAGIDEYGSEEAFEAALEEGLAPTVESLVALFEQMEFSLTGTYEVDGDTVLVTVADETEEWTITDEGLVQEENGLTIVFARN